MGEKKKNYGINDLAKWKDVYDFNYQIYNGNFNIYVSKDDVTLYEVGGYRQFKEAVETVIKWIDRVNKVET